MSLRDKYNKKVNADGVTNSDRVRTRLGREFEKLLEVSPNKNLIQHTKIENIIYERKNDIEEVIINDSKVNDKSFYDEKIVFCKKDTTINVGSYILFNNDWYLVIYEEKRPHGAFKEFVIRICTGTLDLKREWLFEGEIVPSFNSKLLSIPLVIENLTLYSEGVKEINYGMLTIVDGKRNIYYGTDDRLHRFMKVGRRFMLKNETIFNVTHIDNFSFKGLSQITAMQSVSIPEDNKELNIADYYTKTNRPTFDITDTPNLADYKLQLTGVERIKIGSKQEYTAIVTTTNGSEVETALDWVIEHIKGSESDINAELINNKTLTIKVKSDIDITGGQFKVKVSIQDEPRVMIEKIINITSIIG